MGFQLDRRYPPQTPLLFSCILHERLTIYPKLEYSAVRSFAFLLLELSSIGGQYDFSHACLHIHGFSLESAVLSLLYRIMA